MADPFLYSDRESAWGVVSAAQKTYSAPPLVTFSISSSLSGLYLNLAGNSALEKNSPSFGSIGLLLKKDACEDDDEPTLPGNSPLGAHGCGLGACDTFSRGVLVLTFGELCFNFTSYDGIGAISWFFILIAEFSMGLMTSTYLEQREGHRRI